MMEENRKGPGVFYAVVGVATLVVAIIGATFAYFSVTVTPDNTTIQGTTAEGIALSLDVEDLTKTATGALVPLDTMEPWYVADETSQMTSALERSCIDAAENTVCKVYSITISGEAFGTTSLNAKGTLTLTGATNMKWKLIPAADQDNAGAVINGVATPGLVNGEAGVTLNAEKTSDTYFVVVWLEETNADQGLSNEAGVAFNGTVEFSAVDRSGTSTKLTATFAA